VAPLTAWSLLAIMDEPARDVNEKASAGASCVALLPWTGRAAA
jgi:hypothetical protein